MSRQWTPTATVRKSNRATLSLQNPASNALRLLADLKGQLCWSRGKLLQHLLVTHPKNINCEMVSLPRLIFSHCPTSSHQQFIVLQDTSCSSATMHWWCPRQKTRWVWCWHLQPEPSILLACSGQAAWPSETYQQWESQANLATLTTCEGSSVALWKKCVSYAHKHYIYIYTYIYKYMC